MNKVVAISMLLMILVATIAILGVNMPATASTTQQVSVQITLENIKYVNVSVWYLYSNNTVKMLASYILNKSSEIYVPAGSYLAFESSQAFIVVGPVGNVSAVLLNRSYKIVYNYPVNESTTFIIIANTTTTTSTTTSTLPSTTTITLPVPNTTVTITPHTGTVIPTSTASHGIPVGYYAIIVVIVIVLVAFFVLRRVRK